VELRRADRYSHPQDTERCTSESVRRGRSRSQVEGDKRIGEVEPRSCFLDVSVDQTDARNARTTATSTLARTPAAGSPVPFDRVATDGAAATEQVFEPVLPGPDPGPRIM
jgi:hypothetical protein